MARLDPEYAQLKAAAEGPNATAEEKTAATAKLAAREKHLWPAYSSVALEFADLREMLEMNVEDPIADSLCRRPKWQNEGKGQLRPV